MTYNITIALLKALLAYYSEQYYQHSVSEISDAEYDRLNMLLREYVKANGGLESSMDAEIITDHVDGFKKVRHQTMMHSQRDIYTEEELNKWMEEMREFTMRERGLEPTFTVEPKYDGLSCSLIYENGNLVRAATRGDGWEGDDVTAQVMNIPSVPKKISGSITFGTLEVRGEILMPFDAFKRVNEELKAQGKEPLANPRNAASGALKSLDPTVARDRGLEFYAWDAILSNPKEQLRYTHLTMMDVLTVFNTNATRFGSAGVYEYIKNMGEDRGNQRYAIDGAVVKLNQRWLWDKIGMTGKYPKYSVAFKFPQESNYSKLVSVDWQVAKTGKITPVANYEPLQMNGTTCRRATMNSLKWLESNLAGVHIGDKLELIKGGEIIPKILGYVKADDRGVAVMPPDVCPLCSGRLERRGAHLWCPACEERNVTVPKPLPMGGKPVMSVDVPSSVSNRLNGAKVVVTGNFGTPQERKRIEQLCIAGGATLQGSVTLTTTMIVLPDDIESWKRKVPGKWQKIQEYMKQSCMVRHSEFLEMING